MARVGLSCLTWIIVIFVWCHGLIETLAELPAHTSGSPSIEMQPGERYVGGTRVRIPKGDASFVIPHGWQAQLPEDAGAIVVLSESGAGFIMVLMILNVTEDELKGLMGEPQFMTHEMVFQPTGPVEKHANRLTAAYEAGPLTGRALSVLGPTQQGVLFFLGSPHAELQDADLILESLAASTEFDERSDTAPHPSLAPPSPPTVE